MLWSVISTVYCLSLRPAAEPSIITLTFDTFSQIQPDNQRHQSQQDRHLAQWAVTNCPSLSMIKADDLQSLMLLITAVCPVGGPLVTLSPQFTGH